ncbi:hypothetical protein Vretimale_4087 [Volvox reticuliferus]|uniref:Uncharacterized protein n=1 Tax=Volvox reticuliferus TaxID=1737510 RepID=A0A8J4DGB0_9CHLO|nr:hypothetical protein Vretimale_4087 [Volvox reticuliferus]
MQHMAKSLAPIMEEALVHRLVKRYLQCASSLTVEEAVEMLSQTGEAGLCRDKWEHCPPHGAGVCEHSAHEQGLGDGSLGWSGKGGRCVQTVHCVPAHCVNEDSLWNSKVAWGMLAVELSLMTPFCRRAV